MELPDFLHVPTNQNLPCRDPRRTSSIEELRDVVAETRISTNWFQATLDDSLSRYRLVHCGYGLSEGETEPILRRGSPIIVPCGIIEKGRVSSLMPVEFQLYGESLTNRNRNPLPLSYPGAIEDEEGRQRIPVTQILSDIHWFSPIR